MSMTERRESRERLGRLANRNHSPCHTNHTMALNPYPLTPAPPYGRRFASGGLVGSAWLTPTESSHASVRGSRG